MKWKVIQWLYYNRPGKIKINNDSINKSNLNLTKAQITKL